MRGDLGVDLRHATLRVRFTWQKIVPEGGEIIPTPVSVEAWFVFVNVNGLPHSSFEPVRLPSQYFDIFDVHRVSFSVLVEVLGNLRVFAAGATMF